jgi:hypothetical protein
MSFSLVVGVTQKSCCYCYVYWSSALDSSAGPFEFGNICATLVKKTTSNVPFGEIQGSLCGFYSLAYLLSGYYSRHSFGGFLALAGNTYDRLPQHLVS